MELGFKKALPEEKLGFKRGMDKGRRGCAGISEATTMKLAT